MSKFKWLDRKAALSNCVEMYLMNHNTILRLNEKEELIKAKKDINDSDYLEINDDILDDVISEVLGNASASGYYYNRFCLNPGETDANIYKRLVNETRTEIMKRLNRKKFLTF